MSNNKRTIIAGIVIMIVFVYAHTFQNETQAQGEALVVPDTASVDGGSNQQGREILALLADLKKIRLDESIFSDAAFQSLQDLSVELNSEPIGRTNPFAPLGKDATLEESASGFATASPRNIPFNNQAVGTTTASKSGKAAK